MIARLLFLTAVVFLYLPASGQDAASDIASDSLSLELHQVLISSSPIRSMQSHAERLSQRSDLVYREQSASGLATASALGMDARHTQVLWNGLPLNSAQNGVIDLRLLPLTLSKSVDVQPYKSDRSDALGGVIQIDRNRHTDAPLLQLTAGGGSWARRTVELQASVSIADWTIALGAARRTADNDYGQDDLRTSRRESIVLAPARSEISEISIGVSRDLSKRTRISLDQSYLLADRDIPPALYQISDSARQHDEVYRHSLQLIHKGSSDQWKVIHAYQRDDNRYESLLVSPAVHKTSRLYHQVDYSLGSLGTSITVRHWIDEVRSSLFEVLHRRRQMSISASKIFLKDGHEFMARVELRDLTDAELFFAPAVRWSPSENLHVSASRHMLAATMNDLYWPALGNQDLDHERGWKAVIEVEPLRLLKDDNSPWDLRLSTSTLLLERKILWSPDQSGIWSPKNVDDVLSYGSIISLGKSWNLSKGDLHTSLEYQWSRVYSRADQDKKQLIYIPQHQASADVSWYISDVRIRLAYQYRGFTPTTASGDRRLGLRAWHRVSARAEGSIGIGSNSSYRHGLAWFVQLENILNASYEYAPFRPAPPRGWEIGISYRIH